MPDITLDDFHGRTPAELRGLIDALDVRLTELHSGPNGELRQLDDQEQEQWDRWSRLREHGVARIRDHDRAAAAFQTGRGITGTYDNFPGGYRGGGPAERHGDAETATARPGDLLSRDQSVTGWLERTAGRRNQPGGPPVSFDRYIRALVAGAPYGADAETRALSEGTLTAGGHLVPTPLAAQVIDLARNQTQVIRAGAVTVPMTTRTLKVPRLTGEGTPGWHSENAAISAADMTFDAVTFTAQTLTRLVLMSVELFDDADPSASNVIAHSFARQIALELDRAALRGSGTPPEPRGILNTSGITTTTHGVNGSVIGVPPAAGTMGFEFLVDSAAAVRNANFEPTAQIMAPRLPQSLAKLRDTTNQFVEPPAYLDSITQLQSKQIPTTLTVGTSSDCSEVYTAQWDQCWIGLRTDLRILPLRERYIDSGQYGFLAWMRLDVQLAQPTAFVVDTGVRS